MFSLLRKKALHFSKTWCISHCDCQVRFSCNTSSGSSEGRRQRSVYKITCTLLYSWSEKGKGNFRHLCIWQPCRIYSRLWTTSFEQIRIRYVITLSKDKLKQIKAGIIRSHATSRLPREIKNTAVPRAFQWRRMLNNLSSPVSFI